MEVSVKELDSLIQFRCRKCNKLLGYIQGTAEIRCPRCKEINKINTEHPKSADELNE